MPVQCGTCAGRGQVVTSSGFFSVQRPCPTCSGAGQTVANPCKGCGGDGLMVGKRDVELTIPPGIFDGVTLRVPGEGDPAPHGGVPGDLNVRIRIEDHEVFLRSPEDPADLFLQVPVPITTALLGGQVEIPSLTGTLTLDVEAGTEPGDTIYNTAKTELMLQYSTAPAGSTFSYYFRENGRGGWERICHERKKLNVTMTSSKTVVVAVAWEEVV